MARMRIVQVAAPGAPLELTGQRFGYDVAAWRRWWQQAKPALRE